MRGLPLIAWNIQIRSCDMTYTPTEEQAAIVEAARSSDRNH